jgi:methyltransferase
MAFILFVSFIIVLRIAELIVAKRNEKWLLQNGAVEYGKKHYPLIVALHTCFLISLVVEYYWAKPSHYSIALIVVYLLLLVFKAWVIASLGKFWNTKIYHIASFPLVKKGPYKFIKHPNYIIVIAEIAIIPLAFQLYYTAVIFSLLNAAMLHVRIKEENKALAI